LENFSAVDEISEKVQKSLMTPLPAGRDYQIEFTAPVFAAIC
jgi:hypothetical protein